VQAAFAKQNLHPGCPRAIFQKFAQVCALVSFWQAVLDCCA